MKIKLRPLFFTLGTLLLSFLSVFIIIERPLCFASFKSKKIAAIAIRDNVSPFEKRGSALFTIPYLRKFYSDFIYREAGKDWIPAGEFIPNARKLLEDHDSLDVFILSHGNLFYQWFYSLKPHERNKIRLVYNTGCNNDSQCIAYKDLGIKYYVGHTGENSLSPVFYVYFLRRIFAEDNISDAAGEANVSTRRTLSTFIFNDDTIAGSAGNFHSFSLER